MPRYRSGLYPAGQGVNGNKLTLAAVRHAVASTDFQQCMETITRIEPLLFILSIGVKPYNTC